MIRRALIRAACWRRRRRLGVAVLCSLPWLPTLSTSAAALCGLSS